MFLYGVKKHTSTLLQEEDSCFLEVCRYAEKMMNNIREELQRQYTMEDTIRKSNSSPLLRILQSTERLRSQSQYIYNALFTVCHFILLFS